MRFTRRKPMTDVQIPISCKICPDLGIHWSQSCRDAQASFWCSISFHRRSKSTIFDLKLMVSASFGFRFKRSKTKSILIARVVCNQQCVGDKSNMPTFLLFYGRDGPWTPPSLQAKKNSEKSKSFNCMINNALY